MVTETEYKQAKTIIREYELQKLLSQVGSKHDYIGKYALCWYFKNKADGNSLELYFCKVLEEKRGDKIKCEIYAGERFNPDSRKWIVNDVCFEDLSFDKSCFQDAII